MKIHTFTEIDIETGEVLADEFFEYAGDVALCDRSAYNQAQAGVNTNNSNAGTFAADSGADRSALFPTLKADMSGTNGLTADQKNRELVAANQGSGGAAGSLASTAASSSARSRNSGSLSGVMDAIQRSRLQAASGAGLKVEQDSDKLAQQRQAQATGTLSGLYGTDVGANLKSLGLANEDINTELGADKTGWLQNAEGVVGTLGGAAVQGGKIATGSY